jgi:hypothetical protein
MQAGVFEVKPDPEAARAHRLLARKSVAQRTVARQHARFIDAEERLGQLLPARFEAGESWNVLSAGDIDALSYVKHIMAGERFTTLVFACWAISRPAIEFLQTRIQGHGLQHIDAYVGDIMPRDRPDLHTMLCTLIGTIHGRCIAFKNHAKLWLFLGPNGRAVVMQTSANPNYNRRTEQTVITCDAAVAQVYKQWFDRLDLPAPTFPNWTPNGWTPAQA